MMALTSLLLSIVCKATNNSEGDSGGFCAVPLVPDQINIRYKIMMESDLWLIGTPHHREREFRIFLRTIHQNLPLVKFP